MKNPFARKPKKEEGGNTRLGGVSFAFSEAGKKHAVSIEDMPEDVRAYFEELGGQTREESGEGPIMMNSDNMPDYVADYLHEKVSRYLDDLNEDELGNARLSDLPRNVVQDSFFEMIDSAFERYAKKYPECRDDLKPAVGPLKLIADILLHTDEDWQGLKVMDAGRLYGGVAMAMMESCIMAHNLNKVGWEDRNDEEENS